MKEKIREFFEPPKRMLFKPKDWEQLSRMEQREWKSRHWDFLIALTAVVVSGAALIARMLMAKLKHALTSKDEISDMWKAKVAELGLVFDKNTKLYAMPAEQED